MDRRKFLRNSGIAGIAIPAVTLKACDSTPGKENEPESGNFDFELDEVTIDELQ